MAIGANTFTAIGGGVSDIFQGFAAAEGAQYKAQGDILEAQAYGEAEQLAKQNEQYTGISTALQEAQKSRELNMSLGKTTQEVAGAGFALSGSALDILRSSAAQGSLAKATAATQGAITEAGYAEQAQSYGLMQQAAYTAAQGEQATAKIAETGSFIAGGIDIAGGIASLFV